MKSELQVTLSQSQYRNDCYAVQAFPPEAVWCACVELCVCVRFEMAEWLVDGIKPTASVDCADLLALMGRLNAECCRLERKGGFKVFSCNACF